MNVEQFFLDPRRVRSQELVGLADRAEDEGDLAAELAHYAEAARLEEENALDVPGDVPRVRTVLAISAVALWLRAERWDEAARAGYVFLTQPDKLTADGPGAIRKLVERAWCASEVQQALGAGAGYIPVEVTLSGGLVRHGLAPRTVFAERRDVLEPLLIRVAEWRNRKRYRRAGASTLANSYDILEGPSVAGTSTLRLYVGAVPGQAGEAELGEPEGRRRRAAGAGTGSRRRTEAVRELAGDDAYAHAFLRGFRELSPDGKAVGRVEVGTMIRGRLIRAATLTSETREALTIALRQHGEDAVALDGVLKSVNLRGDEPRIGLDTTTGVQVFRIAKGELDDTISTKLNRRVRILRRQGMSADGEVESWADDVVLLEDPIRAPAA